LRQFRQPGRRDSYGTLKNSIMHYNIARLDGANFLYGTLNYCCTTPLAAGRVTSSRNRN